ncbi:MAG: formate/nitrite transporter family protein [Candidatus Eremiobacteraeota bacterium]|nr:formate/nitrite transporter family protein [Candidatus Eremiobacteraeota bacterium]
MASESSGTTVDLSDAEQRDVDERTPPRAAVIFETVRREGEIELDRPVVSLAASGLAAGLSMGMSLVGEGLIRTLLPDEKWRPLIVSFGYTLGFLVVVLGRQQLFTENTVTAILPLLDDPDKGKVLRKVVRLWGVVLVANISGAAIFAYAAVHSAMFDDSVRATFGALGREAAAPTFGVIVVRGIVAGWLIALMVWLMPGSEQLRLVVIVIVTYFVGLGSFSHIIAGSVEVLYVVASGGLSWAQYLGGFLLPVFIGNVIGGVTLVSLLNYAQVVAEGQAQPRRT